MRQNGAKISRRPDKSQQGEENQSKRDAKSHRACRDEVSRMRRAFLPGRFLERKRKSEEKKNNATTKMRMQNAKMRMQNTKTRSESLSEMFPGNCGNCGNCGGMVGAKVRAVVRGNIGIDQREREALATASDLSEKHSDHRSRCRWDCTDQVVVGIAWRV